jgi:hypothetical protein
MDLILIDKVQQVLWFLTSRSEDGVDGRPPEHVHGGLQLAVCDVEGLDDVLELLLPGIVCPYHAPPHLVE